MSQPLSVALGKKIKLADFDPAYNAGLKKSAGQSQADEFIDSLDGYAERLYAEHRRAILIVLQGMDTSGKDGTIRHVLRGLNPQSCTVTSFKAPSSAELAHDFLWRVHQAVPPQGNIGIFNRSHYEDVLVVRVRKLAPQDEWKSRYERINNFEKLLCDGGLTILKFFLHISKEEQRKRLQERIDQPEKRWKFRMGDLDDRQLWDEYQAAYEDALNKCNTDHAPWHIIPADHKWYRNLAISHVLSETLAKLDPQCPPPPENIAGLVVK